MKRFNVLVCAALGVVTLGLTGCHFGPPPKEQWVEIEPHETAFLIPLEGDTELQGKFDSAEFLNEHKIAAKRITLPIRKKNTGRMPGAFEWVPTAKVIRVSRKPIYREWVSENESGVSPTDDALHVESLDKVKFGMGAVISALVLENDAHIFLYNFNGRSLEEIVDRNVRGFCQTRLSEEFTKLSLTECKKRKSEIFNRVEEEVKVEFKKRGLTIEYFGSFRGMDFVNDKVQEAIDREYLVNVDGKIASMREVAQDVRNATAVLTATAEADAARALAEAQAAVEFTTQLRIAEMNAEARKTLATRVEGGLPTTVLPGNGGGNLLLGLPAEGK